MVGRERLLPLVGERLSAVRLEDTRLEHRADRESTQQEVQLGTVPPKR